MAMVASGGGESQDQLPALMPPPPPKAPGVSVRKPLVPLEEEEYTAKIEAIIERDYFPDIPKMQNQLEWIQAVNSRDPAAIRKAQLNIARRRAGLKTPLQSTDGVEATPATERIATSSWATPAGRPGTSAWATPAGSGMTGVMRTPAMTPLAAGSETPAVASAAAAPAPPGASGQLSILAGEPRAPAMGLDEFLAKHTSEDNESFQKILEEEGKRKRARYEHHLRDQNTNLKLLEAPQPTDEYGSSGQQPMTLAHWKHVPHNSLFYDPSKYHPVALSTKELADRVQGPPKQINAKNTRLKPADTKPDAAIAAAAAAAAAHAADQLTADGDAEKFVSMGGAGAYSRLGTPAFTPGADGMSPFMTWGEIESTPLRLDVEDIPFDPSMVEGPSFKVQAASKREETARALATKAAGALHQRKGTTPLLHVLQHHRARSSTGALSPAARKLATMLKGSKGGTSQHDKQLRASYARSSSLVRGAATPLGTPSLTPHHGSSAAHTPVVGAAAAAATAAGKPDAPAAAAAAAAATAASKPGAAAAAGKDFFAPGADGHSITDNLLSL